MDFDLASKHKREVEQRRKEAKRKLDQQRKDDHQRATMEQEHREREEARLQEAEEERQRLEREALLNEGVRYLARLRPYPSSRTDDKIELPPSALQELERQGALERGTLLTFQVALPSIATKVGVAVSSGSTGRTHAGVAEFTAEEGTVGVPPRVALCLTKGCGLDSLQSVSQVEVRYVRLPRPSKSRVKFQPRGQGFHAGGLKKVRIDLEHVLQESLRGHTALTEGDWLPIRHDGYTYELVVRELEPDSSIALIDTDLTVEVLPSEQTEADLLAEEERKAQEEAAIRETAMKEATRLERARMCALSLPPEPEAGPDTVLLLVRLPNGSRLQRRFGRAERLEQALAWVESEPSSFVEPGCFRLVQKWPGHCRELGPNEASETILALGFAKQEALFLQTLGPEPPQDLPSSAENIPDVSVIGIGGTSSASGSSKLAPSGAWAAAEERAHEALDRRLNGEGTPTATISAQPDLAECTGTELVAVFERLVALGMQPEKAAVASKRFAAQLRELGDMGFENWLEAVDLLERYGGRLLRVANLLSEQAASGTDITIGSSSSVPPSTTKAQVSSAPKPAAATPTALPKEIVAAKFQELIATGISPTEAAARAIQIVRESLMAEEPSSAASVGLPFQQQLVELAAMGFTDEERNRSLLRKYAGRMERVIEGLCSDGV